MFSSPGVAAPAADLTAHPIPAALVAQKDVLDLAWRFFTEEGTFSMYSVYLVCAILGVTVIVLQMLILLIGFGDVDDFDGDADASDGMTFLSIRALSGFFAFFGITGIAGINNDWHPLMTLGVSTGSGLAMLFAVAWLLATLHKLTSKGNLEPARAVGRSAQVYLRIPEGGSGQGKITVQIQGREIQLPAMTRGAEIPTGRTVRVVGMPTNDLFEVEPLDAAPDPAAAESAD